MLDIFRNDAFTMLELSKAMSMRPYIPGRLGQLFFSGVGEGVKSTVVTIEEEAGSVRLLPTAPRGAPGTQIGGDKRKLRAVRTMHIPAETTINADELAGIRAMGTEDQFKTFQSELEKRMDKMNSAFALTQEKFYLGAIQGMIYDNDPAQTLLLNAYTLFGVTAEPEFDMELDDTATDIRLKCMALRRTMLRNTEITVPGQLVVIALCGDNFFDALISHPYVKNAYEKGVVNAERFLTSNYAFGSFELGGIVWENYRGTNDNSTVAVGSDKCIFAPVNVPGLFAEYFAPADTFGAINQPGIPRYMQIAPDRDFDRFVQVRSQTNPLPICTYPKILMTAKKY